MQEGTGDHPPEPTPESEPTTETEPTPETEPTAETAGTDEQLFTVEVIPKHDNMVQANPPPVGPIPKVTHFPVVNQPSPCRI